MPAARKPAARSAFFRGAAGADRLKEEQEYQKQRAEQRKQAANMPFRFYVPVGENRQYIICDEAPDFFMYEHGLKDAEGRWGRLFSGCVKTFDNCPVCEATGRESYYALYLTVIDLTPFEMRDGTQVDFSRKLLVVKLAQQKKFLRLYEKHGTLRGALIEVTRDGDKDAAIGNDIEFLEFVDEDEMQTYTRSWKDADGKKHSENCDEVLVYEELFEEPDVEVLRKLVGADPAPGSRAANDRELGGRGGRSAERPARGGRGKDKDWEDGEEEREYSPPARRGRGAPKAEEAEEEEEPPFDGGRPRRTGRAEPAPARRGRAAPADEREEEEEQEAPRSRRGREEPAPARRGRAAPEPAPRRGRAAPAEEEEQEEEDPPRRTGRTGRAEAPAPRRGSRR